MMMDIIMSAHYWLGFLTPFAVFGIFITIYLIDQAAKGEMNNDHD